MASFSVEHFLRTTRSLLWSHFCVWASPCPVHLHPKHYPRRGSDLAFWLKMLFFCVLWKVVFVMFSSPKESLIRQAFMKLCLAPGFSFSLCVLLVSTVAHPAESHQSAWLRQLTLALPACPRDVWKKPSCGLHVVSDIILGAPIPHSSALVESDLRRLAFRPPTACWFPAWETSRAHLAAIRINSLGTLIPYFSSDHLLPLPMPEVAGNPPAVSAHRCALFGPDQA